MKKIVTIGGGTGSYMMLSGLKHFPLHITAVYSTFDNGGSTGVLRDEFGILPPGDVRRCLLALSEGKRAEILRQLFNFRFDKKESALHGHSFGNLFLLALNSIYGSETEAIHKASELLHLKGTVLPVSLDHANLHAVLENGEEITGETNIDVPKHNGDLKIQKLFLKPPARLYPETAAAIHAADIVVIGPGDLYTSLIPNFLVSGMRECLAESPAKKVAVCNVMTKWGETHNFTASDMVRELLSYSGLSRFDHVLCAGKEIAQDIRARYEKEKQYPMRVDEENLSRLAGSVIKIDKFAKADVVRYDPTTIARIISEL